MSTKRKIIDPRRYLRRWSRRDVRIAADVDILLHNNKKFTTGVAIIRNISLRGALIGRMVLKKQVLPASWFRIRVNFKSDEYKGIGALCRPIRFGRGDEFELAVEFEDFWARTDVKRKKKKSRAKK